MPYIKEICIAGSVITIRRYHTLRYNCRGERRESREKVTTAKQETINRRLAERKLLADCEYLLSYHQVWEVGSPWHKSM